ncbi:MAG: hypothetical protein LBS81_02410 [Endomicrobium sp.]|jgi:single-stranded-DNA-specific exonuclease|nr:hypothetical protein [Endomicrobium sp.]
MVKIYSKPAFLFITDGKEATGAARSVEDFDVVAALESVKDILIKYGGHSRLSDLHWNILRLKNLLKEFQSMWNRI